MTNENQPTVLDVGQCSLDHGNISQLLSEAFGAVVQQADSLDQAMEAVRRGGFDLVLVNRIFDADGVEGLELIRRLRADSETAATPVMLVSNFQDAQDAAVSLGANPGFGKSALEAHDTLDRLASILRAPAPKS